MQDLPSGEWNDPETENNQPKTTQQELVNVLRPLLQRWQKLTNTMGWNPALPERFPTPQKQIKTHLKFAKDLVDPEEVWENVVWSDETKMKLYTTRCVCMKNNELNPQWIMGVEISFFGNALMQKEQEDLSVSMERWMGPCIVLIRDLKMKQGLAVW